MEELALREGFRDGDLDAWSVLLRECQPMLQRAIASKLLGAPDREDALTAVWEHAWRCRATYDAAYPALPWLLGICIHVCGEARREHTRFRVALGRLQGDVHGAVRDPVLPLVRGVLDRALDRLPPKEQAITRHRYVHGLLATEIALLTGMTPGAVRASLHRALRRLQGMAEVRELDPRWERAHAGLRGGERWGARATFPDGAHGPETSRIRGDDRGAPPRGRS